MSEIADTIMQQIARAPLSEHGDMDKLNEEIDAVNAAMAAALRQLRERCDQGVPVSQGFRNWLDERATAHASLANGMTARELDEREHRIHKPG